MSIYAISSWLMTICTSVLLIISIYHRRYLLVKPSIILILFLHIFLQWNAALDASHIEQYLPDPWVLFLLLYVMPFFVLAISIFTFRASASIHLTQMQTPFKTNDIRVMRISVYILFFSLALYIGYYFTIVPWSATGLYTILFDPSMSQIAREQSLKLIPDPIIRYGYSLMANFIAPMLAILLNEFGILNWQYRRYTVSLFTFLGLPLVILAVSLSGARGYSVVIVAAIAGFQLLRHASKVRVGRMLMAASTIVLLPTIISILRVGENLTVANIWLYFSEVIVRRLFEVSLLTGLWHIHYVQTSDFIGIGGIRPLATLFDVTSINVPNMIGLLYLQSRVQSVYANTSFIFSYYSYFGLASIIFTAPAILSLDLILPIYNKFTPTISRFALVVNLIVTQRFLASDFTTVLLTHGFLTVLLCALLLDALIKKIKVPVFSSKSTIRQVVLARFNSIAH